MPCPYRSFVNLPSNVASTSNCDPSSPSTAEEGDGWLPYPVRIISPETAPSNQDISSIYSHSMSKPYPFGSIAYVATAGETRYLADSELPWPCDLCSNCFQNLETMEHRSTGTIYLFEWRRAPQTSWKNLSVSFDSWPSSWCFLLGCSRLGSYLFLQALVLEWLRELFDACLVVVFLIDEERCSLSQA